MSVGIYPIRNQFAVPNKSIKIVRQLGHRKQKGEAENERDDQQCFKRKTGLILRQPIGRNKKNHENSKELVKVSPFGSVP